MMVADVFVIFDTVQYTPRHEENRAKLKNPQGSQWFTVPIRRHSREQLLLQTHIDNNQPWRRKAIKTLTSLYGRAPNYKTFSPEIFNIIEEPHKTLTQLDRASWEPALRHLEVTCEFVYASELSVSGKGARLLLDICKHLGSDTYLSGSFGREYLDSREFAAEGVTVKFHEYSYPIYPQRFGDFVPYLSYLDMLFNIGLVRDQVLAGGRILSD